MTEETQDQEVIVEKHSDTELKITSIKANVVEEDIRQKTELLDRKKYLEESIASTQQILSERIATFQAELGEIDKLIKKADVLGVKSNEEKAEEPAEPVDNQTETA